MVLRVIFVLALACACVQASPLRSGFLGRLWRRSTDLVQPTPSPAQGEIATTGQAQLVGTGLDAAIASQHALLATRAKFIWRRIGKLYDDYKLQRFPQGSQQTVSDYSFGGSSASSGLPNEGLVKRHNKTLFDIVETLAQVGESETANVTKRIKRITANISVLIETLKDTMTLMNYEPTNEHIETTVRPFGNATLTDQERNQRTLHILEAAKNYMQIVKEDYRVLNSRTR